MSNSSTHLDTRKEDVRRAWATHAPALAAWCMKALVNRTDAFGHYLDVKARTDPDLTAFTDKRGVTLAVLERHFRGESTGDLIGLHSTAQDKASGDGEVASCRSKWGAVDIDAHGGKEDPDANQRYAVCLYDRAQALGLSTLLLDSNGRGGFHLLILFDAPVPTEKVFAFLRWLIRDWKDAGLDGEPETFPKQRTIKPGGFGNWLRLPGRHHTRDHFTRAWDGSAWLEEVAAVKAILAARGGSAEAIPAEAVKDEKPAKLKRVKLPNDLNRDAQLAREALGHVKHLAGDYETWIMVGQCLTPLGSDGLALWEDWSQNCPEKFTEGSCGRKWRSFVSDGGRTLGSLFHEAKAHGWSGPKKTALTPNAKPSANGNGRHATGGNGGSGDGDHQNIKPKGDRPSIEINTERHRALAETLAVLPKDPDLFCRGNVLVRISREVEDKAKLAGGVVLRRAAGGVRVILMGEAGLSCRLTGLADFFTWSRDQGGEEVARPAHPPTWLVRAILEHGAYPGMRPLQGVAEVPFPRPDGSLVTIPGYDARTGVFYVPSVELAPLPDRPSQADAAAAAETLFGLVEQFPFATQDDRAVWLSGLLTVMARAGIVGAVPGFAYIGNRAGAGKGKLIDIKSVIANGRPVPCTSYPGDDNEMTKLKVALALAATSIVHLDNLDEGRAYGGGALDSALTSLEVTDRILGQSKTTEGLELRCCWFLSGNNIVPAKDAYRRWLVCRLMTELERPEERGDLKIPDLLAHVREHRTEYVRAGLVILRAHAVAGRPTGGWPPLGSFEEWDRVVRGAVWFASGCDCNATRRQAAEESPERLDRLALLEVWCELPSGGPDGYGITAEAAYRLACDEPAAHPNLADALVRFSKDGKVPSPRSIGRTIRAIAGRNINGLAFQKRGEHKRSALWKVVKVPPGKPDSRGPEPRGSLGREYGDFSESVSNPTREELPYYHDVIVYGGKCNANGTGLETDSPNSSNSPGDGREEFTL